VTILDIVNLDVSVPSTSFYASAEFLVVDKLVISILLGTPWISEHVLSINPAIKTVLLHSSSQEEPMEARLEVDRASDSTVLKVHAPRVIPAFSEAWVAVRTNRTGLAALRPTKRREKFVQAKNGVTELPPAGPPFKCLVANLTEYPVEVKPDKEVGVSESVHSYPICAVGPTSDGKDPSWQEIVTSKSIHLTAQELEKLLKILESHDEMWSGRLGKIHAVDHHIPTTGSPISSQPYRAGPQSRELIDAEIKRMLKMDVIEPATSPRLSPIVLIPKLDSSIRFCIDYRRLNAVTENDSYAIPRIDDCLDSLRDARFFTTLDANCGYWQIGVAPTDRNKTTFTSHRGLYRFKRMPFGLMSAPATFQRAIDVILSTARFQCALTYLDDIIIYSPSFEQHLLDLAMVLKLLDDAGVSLKYQSARLRP
jgi:hypothetical protein